MTSGLRAGAHLWLGLFAVFLAVSALPISCGSSDSGGGAGTAGGGTAGGGASSGGASSTHGSGGSGGNMTPADSCVQPGDKGNDKGVGTYCTPGGMQCDAFPEAGLCLADVQQDQWFCTRIGCSDDDVCGKAAYCHHDTDGTACVPDRCGGQGGGGSGGAGGSGGMGASGGTGGTGGDIQTP